METSNLNRKGVKLFSSGQPNAIICSGSPGAVITQYRPPLAKTAPTHSSLGFKVLWDEVGGLEVSCQVKAGFDAAGA